MTNRERYILLEYICNQLKAAGCEIDPGQLDWAVKEVNAKVFEASLERQYQQEIAK